jgi:NADP-dependent 3-hydroxy acid dehydrogenase YdfG
MSNRRALVTGGASGIGRAVVERLLGAGCQVAAVDCRPVPVEHKRLLCVEADITDGEQVDACFARVFERFDGLDILVSNAGMGIHERLDEGDPDKWQRVIETNLVGAMRIVRAFVPLLKTSGRASRDVVVVSSAADRKPFAYGGAYCASKAGLSAMTETLRLELMPGVRVTSLRPGMVDTSFFDNSVHRSSPRPEEVGYTALSPEQVAEAVWFALSRPVGVVVNELTIRPTDQPF